MVEIITGVPGGGKTSYAVVRLIKTFSDDDNLVKKIPDSLKIPDVNKCYTNINEFKFNKFPDNVLRFDFDDIYEKLEILHNHYKKDKWSDKQLQELCDEYNINHAVFVLDEVHNFLDIRNTVLLWWFSYHRHLNHHIICMTQNLSLVDLKYKAFPEFFYMAVPSSLKIFDTNLILRKYTSSRLSKTTEAGKIKIKKFPEIYDYYGSGANHKSKSVIIPFIIISLSALVFLIFYFSYAFSSSSPVSPKEDKNQKSNSNKHQESQKKNQPLVKKEPDLIDLSNKHLIDLYCSKKECFYKDFSFPLQLISKLKSLDSEILFTKKISSSITKYTVLMSSSFYSLLGIQEKNYILGVNNENNVSASYFNVKD